MGIDDPHTVRFPHGHSPAWQVVYWRGNTASGGLNADRAVLEIFVPDFGYSSIGEYPLPDVSGALVRMLNTLDRAHDAGMKARSAQFRALRYVGVSGQKPDFPGFPDTSRDSLGRAKRPGGLK